MKMRIQGHEKKMIKCITFDLDDTLWAVDPVVRAANHTLYEWLYENAPLFNQTYQLRDLNQLREQVLIQQPHIAYSVSRIRLAVLEYGLAQSGYDTNQVKTLAEQAFTVFYQARQKVEFFEHTLVMLEALKASGYRLGAISNGNADVKQVGLSHLLDFQFSADSAGVEKPDPLIFQQMLAHTRLSPEQVIHVGDHPVHDIEGAKAVGIWGVWVNLKGQTWSGSDMPDAEITCLSELPQQVKRISTIVRNRL
ncbi:putative hydrolase of the HAD superfamily [Neptunomonas antarctica]|uniref:Putative hydrolase of the HAD superfamily n=2 Tax=Neptunomonas antarctica TaxID=619304 RepID=A0A1N7J155_9GAMM|nr:putative hydrolase of the HAD superfamily [Neptunomonas antarctica]